MATQNYEVTVNPNAITLDLTTQNNILTVQTVDYIMSLSRTGGQGAQGYSAYEIAVQNGYTGTAQEFSDELASIAEKSALAVASAAAAATSATSASNSATASATSASNSSISAGAASASANAAAQSAVTAAAQANASSQSATNSAASALQSSNYADDSENSAIDSQLSAADAAASEDAAANSEANALLYRNEAQASASSALASSTNANSQALAASLSAASAATSATNADNSEDNAAASATSALNSATSANTSANQAAISATTATTQATSATNSATAAAASQADALVSKNSASASASTATTKASEASNSAATAATKATEASASAAQAVLSATSASTSASTATLKAAEAAQSAADAAAAQAAAEASLASFRSTYLGELNADPTLDGNGDPVMIGAEYFNSVANKLKVYTSTGWQFYDATAQTASQNAALSASQAASSAATSQSYATTAINKAAEAASSADAADASADAALASENAAESSELNASASENYAFNYKNAAATSADLASSYASASGVSATNAAASATTATTQATNSANSATASATSATNSANSALASANSATNAANSAASAATSAANAGVSEANADTSEANALASANTATTKAAEASTSASNAATSATNSAASATSSALSEGLATTAAATATTKASEASVSATSASGSAATATTKAAEATSAASSATTSAANAATSETNAANSASSANTSSASASTSATLAGNSANAAALSETNAATSASAASIYAANAATSASSADTSESNAEIYADDALASSIAAANTVTTVTGYANTASIKADEASASATSAANSATSATASANTAITQATNASNSATAASTSATNASASATTASTQASNAAASASSASTSASAANISAINADTSATNAASSANTANVAKAAAEAARDQALAAFDNFDDKYLGEKASNPTLDNDGNPLVVGALYFNTTLQGMRVYTGTAWVAAYMSGDGYLLASNNLSELTNVVTARANLGLGTSALANGYNLDGLTDVTISSATNGQILEYESATSLWKNKTINALPAQATHNGQFLTTDGTNASWATVDALPPQATHADKFLRTDGTAAYWATVNLPTSAYTRTSFTATAGQTTFNVTYPLGSIQVYVNGVLLRTSDYTATNETSFTLNVPASAGAAVDAFVYNVYGVGQVLAENIIGTVAIGSGGTGATTAAGARTNLGLGTAATTDSTAYATAAQGIKADNAVSEITSIDGSVTITTTGTSRDLSGVSALNLISQVRNETGATLTKGTVVYVSGAASNKALVSKAVATSDSTSAQTFGMVREDIPHNQNGFVTLVGAVRGLDTSMYLNGTQLYLSGTTAGLYTSTKPYAPIHLVYVGVVTYSHANQGTIEVKIQNGYEMDEIHDVSAQNPTNGDTLVYVSSTGLWTKTPQSTLSVASAAAVPFSGVTGKPTTLSGYGITDAYSSSNPSGYISGITSGMVTTALGYTPYNSTNPANYITTAGARSAISVTGAGSYDSATGVINIVGGVTSFNTRTGAISLTSGDVTGALGYTPYNSTNPNGYISGITSSNVTTALGYTPENAANKGNANGYASLDGSGLVPASQLPSYVDDVLEYTNLASFPGTGTTGKIYVALDTNKTYRWSGTTYIYITSGAVDSVAGKTGVVTLNNSDVGLGNVENKSSATIRGEITSSNVTTALGYTPYNSTNPSGYITSSALSPYLTSATAASTYLPLAGGVLSGNLQISPGGSSLNLTGAASRISFRDADLSWVGYVGYVGNVGTIDFSGRNVKIISGWNGNIELNTGAIGYNSGSVSIPYGNLTIQGNTSLHAGNYNSYSPTLTGGNASGTWGINVTGSANSANTLNDGATINGTAYFRKNQTTGNYTTAPLWTESYGNTSTGIAFHISGVAGRYLEMRNNSADLFWQSSAILNAGNYSSYALPLSGGTLTGNTQLYANDGGNSPRLIFGPEAGQPFSHKAIYTDAYWLTFQGHANEGMRFRLGNGSGITTYSTLTSSYLDHGSSLRAPIFYDLNNTAFYVDPAAVGPSAALASSIYVGGQSADGVLWDYGSGNEYRPGIQIRGNYPHIDMIGTAANGSHGPTLRFMGYDSGASGAYKHWVIGSASNNLTFLDIGFSSSESNPHGGIDGYSGTTIFRATTSGNVGLGGDWGSNGSNGNPSFPLHVIGTGYATSDFRAPIFYDSNNTAYYFDPAGTSRQFSTFDIAADGSSGYVASRLYLRSHNNYRGAGVFMFGTDSSWFAGTPYTDFSGQYVISRIAASNDEAAANPAYKLFWVDSSGNASTTSSMRSPIFYDSDDTGRYLNPANTSNLGTVKANVFCGNDGNAYGIYKGYDNNNHFIGIRCVVGGNTTNPTFTGQHSTTLVEYAEANDTTGWFFRTSQTGNYDVVSRITRSYSHFNSSVRSPLFYDSDDTAYYIDPNSTSDSAIRIRGGALFGPNTSWSASLYVGGNGRVGTSATVAVTNGNLHIDAQDGYNLYLNWYANRPTYTQGNMGLGSDSASYRLHVHGTGYATSDFRAPVFYDSNDTGYFCDPTGRSNLYQANFPGGFQFTGKMCLVNSGSTLDNSTGMFLTESYGAVWNGTNSSTWHHQIINASSLVGLNASGGNFGSGNILASGNITAYYSDERLKTKVSSIENALEKVRSLEGFIYVENELAKSVGYTNSVEQAGVSAQRVKAVLPQAVSLAPFDMTGVPETGEIVSKSGENYLTVDYSRLSPLLIEAIKEQDIEVTTLRSQVQQQQSELDELKSLVKSLLANR